jgi:nicotinate-nucleotide adenylyltransferase
MRRPDSLAGVLGIFGGTFDPVHIGHLRTAFELRVRLGLDRVYFVPAAIPPHRPEPAAPAAVRVAILEAVLASDAYAVVDQRELLRDGPSYTIETAIEFRAQFPESALCLLLGMDAFLGLPAWRDWERLLTLVNIVVARRPGASLPSAGRLASLLDARRVDPRTASWAAAGQIVVQNVTQLEVSATDLRASIRDGIEPRYLVPESAWHIIDTSGCYARTDESA